MGGKTIFFYFGLIGVFLMSCTTKTKQETNLVDGFIKEVKTIHAPDKRVALFDVSVLQKGDEYILVGESNIPSAVVELKAILTKQNISFKDSILVLPDASVEGKTKGLVSVSVANIRSKNKHSGELATQATLGTPVNILKKEGDWLLIQTPDLYISWVDQGAIIPYTVLEFDTKQKSKKVIYTHTSGFVYDKDATIVSDIVAGGILELLAESSDYFKVQFPDGRIGFIKIEEAKTYENWLTNLSYKEEDLVLTSMQFMGLPYLWGGTSTKGVDCSGFTKSIYFLNGMVIPRDASQQVHTGQAIDSVGSFSNLNKGDLLFFGRKKTDSTKERVVHVGMWIGNTAFIHASGAGRVQIGSMDENAANYDAFNKNRYLRTKRILKVTDKAIIDLGASPLFKD